MRLQLSTVLPSGGLYFIVPKNLPGGSARAPLDLNMCSLVCANDNNYLNTFFCISCLLYNTIPIPELSKMVLSTNKRLLPASQTHFKGISVQYNYIQWITFPSTIATVHTNFEICGSKDQVFNVT